MFAITNPVTLHKRTEAAVFDMQQAYKDAKRVFLRASFDRAVIDATALAIIKITKAEGFVELANEMEADFKSETGKDLDEC